MEKDSLHVIHACAAGIDVHKIQVTATVRTARENAEAEIVEFRINPLGEAGFVPD